MEEVEKVYRFNGWGIIFPILSQEGSSPPLAEKGVVCNSRKTFLYYI